MKKLLWELLNKKVWLFLVVLLGISASFGEVKGQDYIGRRNGPHYPPLIRYFIGGTHTCAEEARCFGINSALSCHSRSFCTNYGPQKPICDNSSGCRQQLGLPGINCSWKNENSNAFHLKKISCETDCPAGQIALNYYRLKPVGW